MNRWVNMTKKYTSEEILLLERMAEMGPTHMLFIFHETKKAYDEHKANGNHLMSYVKFFKKFVHKDDTCIYAPSGKSLEDIIYKMSIKNMPLFVNDFFLGIIAKWRLKIGK